jgi:predicted nuclease with TOPRIM domain
MEEQTLYQRVKSTFNEVSIGARFTSQEIIEKTGGTQKKVSIYLGSIKKTGAMVRINETNPAIYEKVHDFRTEPRTGRIERTKEREFTALEIGEGVIKHIKKLEKASIQKEECIKALKDKVDELMKEVQDLRNKLELSRKNVAIVNRKANGERIRLSL